MKQLLITLLTIATLVYGFGKLLAINEEKTQQCIAAGHNEHFCMTGEGPRY